MTSFSQKTFSSRSWLQCGCEFSPLCSMLTTSIGKRPSYCSNFRHIYLEHFAEVCHNVMFHLFRDRQYLTALTIFEHWAGGGPPSLYLTKFLNLIQCRKNLSPSTSVRACTLGVHLSQKLLLYPPPNPQKRGKKNCGQFVKRARKPLGKIWRMQKTD